MKSVIMKAAGMAFLFVGVSGFLMAGSDNGFQFNCPEIDAASASTALALLSGAVLMIRSRKK
ncbi:MAG: hypothetical protein ACLPWF_16740 [Bryobacteraceae bacterium]